MRASAETLSLSRLSTFGLQTLNGPPPPVAARAMGGVGGGAPSAPVPDTRCTSLSYSDVGDYLVSSHNDSSLRLLSGAQGGAVVSELHVRETGCRLVTHTHHPLAVLHAAAKGGALAGRVSYHSLQENRIVRTFEGHTDFVTSISMSPADDAFLTASRDGTWKLWDLRARSAVAGARMPVRGLAVAGFDARAKIFAVATPQRMLALYDPKTMTAFSTTAEPLMQQTVTPGKDPPGKDGRGVAGAPAPAPSAALGGPQA